MQTRLIACLAGGLLGCASASLIGGALGLSPALALLSSSLAGIALGCVVSLMVDVFSGSHSRE